MTKKEKRVLTIDEKKEKRRITVSSVFAGIGVALFIFGTFALPELLELWFEASAIETVVIVISLAAMTFIIWLAICLFSISLRREKDSLEDKDKPKIYSEVGIGLKERCITYVDVCSISRALNKEGLNIPLPKEEKEKYRLNTLSDIKEDIETAQEVTILCEQNNDLTEIEQSVNQLLIKAVNNGLNLKYLYVEKGNREIDVEQVKVQLEEATKGGKGTINFKEIGDKNTVMGNAVLSCTKIILISKKGDKKGYYSIGYMKLYSAQNEEELYYRMPFCTLKSYARFADECTKKEVMVLKHREQETFKEFVIKPIVSMSHYKDLLKINNELIEENIDVKIFSAPSKEEILESLDKDIVYGVFHHHKLVAFSITILDRNSERDLSNYYPKYKKEECASFDNVEVRKEFRGYGLEKALIEIAKKEVQERGRKHLLAVVSKDNVASLSSFKKCDFKTLRSDIKIYNSTRELVGFDL